MSHFSQNFSSLHPTLLIFPLINMSASIGSEAHSLAVPAAPEGMHFGTTWGPPTSYSQFPDVRKLYRSSLHILTISSCCVSFSLTYLSYRCVCSSNWCPLGFLTEMPRLQDVSWPAHLFSLVVIVIDFFFFSFRSCQSRSSCRWPSFAFSFWY